MQNKFLLTVLALLLGICIPLFAGTTGKIVGVVKEKSTGEPLPGANVYIEGTNLGAATDVDGSYLILNVPPGTYTLVVSYIGYQEVRVSGVRVSVDLTTRQDFELVPTALELGEAVVVEATQELVQKDLTSSEARVSADKINQLPVNEVNDILQIQSGVTRDASGAFHIRGGRSTEIAYWVNGVSITDAYDGSRGFEVENQSIQELQVISGTFNAEYGNAMSGIINIVTKEGTPNYKGNVRTYVGDYVSSHKDLFYNIDNVSAANYNFEASLSGPLPLTNKKVTFFGNWRNYYTDGWLYGKRIFLPTGQPGDSAAVAMNWRHRVSAQLKLTYFVLPTLKVSLEGLGSKERFRDYNHEFKYNPDGDVQKRNEGYNYTLLVNHTLSSRTYYTLNLSYFNREFNEYLYPNPFDPRYLHPDSLNKPTNFSFHDKGTNLHRFQRWTKTYISKFDLTSQVNKVHLVKGGVELRYTRFFVEEVTLTPKIGPNGQQVVPFEPDILPISTPVHNLYEYDPVQFSAYIQDKIEFASVIINAGIRFDYFNPKGRVLADPKDPNIYNPLKEEHKAMTLEERRKIWYKKVDPKYQISPRLGIAYPISANGVIHFSFGHFMQIPPLFNLYYRSDYKITEAGASLEGPFGNQDLDAQRTVMYEMGLQQKISTDLSLDITGFYRDVRNWITTSAPIETYVAGKSYSIYINKDYANVRGVTLSLKKRFSNHFAFDVVYQFQVAEGTNSNPDEEFQQLNQNYEPTIQLAPLDWDQTHNLNVSLFVGIKNWGMSVLSRYNTGMPYTPQILTFTQTGQNVTTAVLKNSRRKPNNWVVDFRLFKDFTIRKLRFRFYTQILNLFDRKNELNVWADTGRADYTLTGKNAGYDPRRPNTVKEYLTHPEWYGQPREVQFGLEIQL